jgi:hypothetical protein
LREGPSEVKDLGFSLLDVISIVSLNAFSIGGEGENRIIDFDEH